MTTTTEAPMPVPTALFRTLKHEWLRTRGMLGGIALLATLTVVLATVVLWLGRSVEALAVVGVMLGLFTIILLVPATQLGLAADFWRSSFSRTGYLTHSLPVRGAVLYGAKLTWVALVTIAGLIYSGSLLGVLWVGIAQISHSSPNPFLALRALWDQVTAVTSPGMMIALVLGFVAMYLIWPAYYYFSMSIGAEQRLNRFGFGGAVLVFVVLYVTTQVIGLVTLLTVPVGLGMREDGLGLVPFSTGSQGVMPLGVFPVLILVAALCVWRTAWSWNRKVSLT